MPGEGLHGQSPTTASVSCIVSIIVTEVLEVIITRVTCLKIRIAPKDQRLTVLLVAMVWEVCITIES